MNPLKSSCGWVSKSKNQKTLAFIGTGLAIAIGGVWQAYLHISEKPKESSTVTASGGGIAAGGNVVAKAEPGGTALIQTGSGKIQVHYGISENIFEKLSVNLGVTQAALASFFEILEQQQVPLNHLDSTLRDIAKRYKELQAKLAAFSSDDEAVAALKHQAKEALDRLDFNRAEVLLNEVSDADVAAAKAMQANSNKRLLSAAAAKAEAGDVKYTQLAYLKAAVYYQKAAQLVPPDEDAILAGYLNQQGGALYSAGHYSEAQLPLELALTIREKALGPEHPNVATILENYAVLLRKLGRTAEAGMMEARAKTIRACALEQHSKKERIRNEQHVCAGAESWGQVYKRCGFPCGRKKMWSVLTLH